MTSWAEERQDTADRLIDAMERDRFVLHRQEIKPLQQKEAFPFYEILIRFLDEEEVLLPPGTFIPVLESYTLMYMLDRWVITQVMSLLQDTAAGGKAKPPARYSVNLSAETLRNHESPGFILEQLQLFKADPRAVCFEVSEADAEAHVPMLMTTIKRLKTAGCGFALTGYNGDRIAHDVLQKLGLELVKIDADLVKNIHASKDHLKAVQSINEICHLYKIRTVGELVERPETLKLLKGARVDYAQGFAAGGSAAPLQ